MWDTLFKAAAVIGIIHFWKTVKPCACDQNKEKLTAPLPPNTRTVALPSGALSPATKIVSSYGLPSTSSGKGIIEDLRAGRLGDAPYTGRGAP